MLFIAAEPKIGVDLVSGHVEHAVLLRQSAASSLNVYGALIKALSACTITPLTE